MKRTLIILAHTGAYCASFQAGPGRPYILGISGEIPR